MQPETDSKPKNFFSNRSNIMGPALVLLYLIVLVLGTWSVYSTQNAKLKAAEKAAAQAAEKAKTDEAAFVDGNKYQAVFLDNGQVYFGKVKDMNPEFVTITNIYYLNTGGDLNTLRDDGSASLVRLGCELHGPDDKMVIERSSVTFWENLKNDGQVVKAINQHIRSNGDSPKCE